MGFRSASETGTPGADAAGAALPGPPPPWPAPGSEPLSAPGVDRPGGLAGQAGEPDSRAEPRIPAATLQALLDACADPAYGAAVVAVGADRAGIRALERARKAGVATFVVRLEDCVDRAEFDRRTAAAIAGHEPHLVVCAGYMRLLGADVVQCFHIVNTHPALLPACLLYTSPSPRDRTRSRMPS